MRRVLYITGSRADYGPARSTLQAIDADPELGLSVLVTGMHLDPVHGETWREIEADGLTIVERVDGLVASDSLGGMAASIGLYLHGRSQAIERLQPDGVLVLGYRGERLAGASAAALQNIADAGKAGRISIYVSPTRRQGSVRIAQRRLCAASLEEDDPALFRAD